MNLSKIKDRIKRDFGLSIDISAFDTKHFFPHLHIFTGEDNLVLSLEDFTIIEPHQKVLKQSSIDKVKRLVKFLRKPENQNILDFLIETFYLYNPDLKRLRDDKSDD